MTEVISCTLLKYRWSNVDTIGSCHWHTRSTTSMANKERDLARRVCCALKDGLYGDSNLQRRGALDVLMTHSSEKKDLWCNSDSSAAESKGFLSTSITVNLSNQTVKLDFQELQIADPNEFSQGTEKRQNNMVTSTVPGTVDVDVCAEEDDIVVAKLEVRIVDDVQKRQVPTSILGMELEKWWHIPDCIEEVLPLPPDFKERLKILSESFGCQVDSRELLLRVLFKRSRDSSRLRVLKPIAITLHVCYYPDSTRLRLLDYRNLSDIHVYKLREDWTLMQVHKSYYEGKVPVAIKEQVYRKPSAAMSIESGEVKHQDVKGLPIIQISCMTFSEAHAEVRSQLAILGDAVICLAVSSLLVRQHSSAGMVTERKCQLVSNSNLSRVWRTLLEPKEDILSCGTSSSQPGAHNRMMADSCEAYIGALYAEKGFETAYNCVSNVLLPLLVQANSVRNAVHALNVHSSMAFQVLPEYRLIGVDNANTKHEVCRVRVYVRGHRMATGMGKNQKLARVDAAEKALERWPVVFGDG